MKVLITGASGLLGRAVFDCTRAKGWDVTGLAYSRVGEGLEKVDLTNHAEIQSVIERIKPDFIIHAAAQRAPDKVENDYENTRLLNITASQKLTEYAKNAGSRVIYVSTDYVFDGANPPYTVDDTPKPLNKYGITKLDGEKAVLAACEESLVLRVPILYGPVERIDESAVTCLLTTVQNTAKSSKVSHYEKRYPAYVSDVALILCQLIEKAKQDASVRGIYQWSGLELLTKYDMCVAMAAALDLSSDHLTPDDQPTQGAARPYDSRMDNSRLEQLGISQHTPFKDGIRECLAKWVVQK